MSTMDSEGKQKSKAAKSTTVATTSNGLRMCHSNHLNFTESGVSFVHNSKTGGKLIDGYFTSSAGNPWDWQGSVYRVAFPDGTTRDIIACRRYLCDKCRGRAWDHRKKGPKPMSPASALPFVHHKDLKFDYPAKVFRFTPVGIALYEDLSKIPHRTGTSAIFARGGPGGASEIDVSCEICVEGKCSVCDEIDRLESDGDAEEAEEGEEEVTEQDENGLTDMKEEDCDVEPRTGADNAGYRDAEPYWDSDRQSGYFPWEDPYR